MYLQRLRVPNDLVEAFDAAMQMVRLVVSREFILGSIQREPAPGDPVAIAANQRTEKSRGIRRIIVQSLKSENYVIQLSIAVRYLERYHHASISHYSGFCARAVSQGVNIDRLGVRSLSKALFLHRSLPSST